MSTSSTTIGRRRGRRQVNRSADHVTGGLSPCHEWVEGLLDTYHFTGRPEALAGAVGIARHVLGALEANTSLKVPGAAAARVTGWALRTLVAMYRETGEQQYLTPAAAIVDGFLAWHAEYGGFLAPYHDHTLCRVPFMIAIACGSLYRFHQSCPPRVATLIPMMKAPECDVPAARRAVGLQGLSRPASARGGALRAEALAYPGT